MWLKKKLDRDILNHMVEQAPLDLNATFHALADETRRALLQDIAQSNAKTVSALAAPYAMSLAAVSKHLDVLERASLIQRRRQGTRRLVSLKPQPLKSAQEWLAFYQTFWTSSLDRLQSHFDKQAVALARRPKRKDR